MKNPFGKVHKVRVEAGWQIRDDRENEICFVSTDTGAEFLVTVINNFERKRSKKSKFESTKKLVKDNMAHRKASMAHRKASMVRKKAWAAYEKADKAKVTAYIVFREAEEILNKAFTTYSNACVDYDIVYDAWLEEEKLK